LKKGRTSSEDTLPFEGDVVSEGKMAWPSSGVECLGKTFESDDARRAHYLGLLREKLKDSEFRKTPGFPIGSDEDILKMSDPPYYTACPNPFLEEFVRVHGKPYDPKEKYHRDPFAVDVSVGKTDPLYKAHGYHTKVPHLAIVPSILHYTKPGDIVLDGFAGSGMTGVAAQWCGCAPASFRVQLEAEWKAQGRAKPEWGPRLSILNDLGPAATFISAGYNLQSDTKAFVTAAKRLLDEVDSEVGWMYQTSHGKSNAPVRVNYTVWSEVFTCPECAAEIVFVDVSLDKKTGKTKEGLSCSHCRAKLRKGSLERSFETSVDPLLGSPWRRIRLRPVLLEYTVDGKKILRPPTGHDLELHERIAQLPAPPEMPDAAFPFEDMWEAPRIEGKGLTHVHHLFLPRAARALSCLWRRATEEPDAGVRRSLLFFVEQAIWGMSLMARYAPTHYSQVNQYLAGTYYVGSQVVDASPRYILGGKVKGMERAFSAFRRQARVMVSTGDCANLPIADASVDYVFTDPPFGDNFAYAELNFLVESWHGVRTDAGKDTVVDRAKENHAAQKTLADYQRLMTACFSEYYRVLKPGRWITVVFSNSRNSVWRAIQEALGTAGFVVGDVRTLDKQQLTLKQLTSSAVKQDLVISAYRPTAVLSDLFKLGTSSENAAWAFIREHLSNAPGCVEAKGQIEVIVERTAQMLLDRMIAFHVQRGLAVPLSGSAFLLGLEQRFAQRDGMYFLAEQAAEYDRRRAGRHVGQLALFVTDEATAVQWVRQELKQKPRTYQDLNPVFHKAMHTWSKHEKLIELSDILKYNFLCYEGEGPVPNPIHGYLSTNFKDFRKRAKDDPELKAKATDIWYVPDPGKEGDLEKLREKALLREFEEYKATSQKTLKVFRTEAVRVGFKAAYDARDWKTIVSVGEKLPDSVLQEDEKLLMYYDVASMRAGE
jgi:16S rRNA G966 N2-methylase RsmD